MKNVLGEQEGDLLVTFIEVRDGVRDLHLSRDFMFESSDGARRNTWTFISLLRCGTKGGEREERRKKPSTVSCIKRKANFVTF